MSTHSQNTSPKRLNFYGALTDTFGEGLDAYVRTPREAVQLIHANNSSVAKKYLLKGKYAIIKNGKEPVTSQDIDTPLEDGDELSFVPNVAGKDFGLILGIIAVVLAVVAIGLAFMGLPEDELSQSSGGIQRGVNTGTEGDMVPIIYGEVRSAPKVISSQRIAEHPAYNTKQVLPNTVTSTIVFACSEGQVEGLGATSSDQQKKILLNGTQIRSDSGTLNYDDIIHEFRDGSDPQTRLNLMQGSASPRDPAVNQALKYNDPVTVTLTTGIDAARVQLRCQSMFKTKNGKIKPTEVEFRIEKKLTSGGSWSTVTDFSLYGRYTATQLFQIFVPLDDSDQYDVRVTRLTPDAQDENTNDNFTFENVEEVNNDQVSYDGTSLLALQYDQTSFNGRNPEVEIIQKGKLVRIPTNFDPITRTYTGVWDGSFTEAWTDSVAWCTADLIDNNRYGVGIKLRDRYNKFNLYELDQYAVVDVDDGFGGTEPRFTMNVEIDSRDKAIEALAKIGSIFRASPYWFASELNFSMDKAEDVTRVITQAKVKNGEFSYSGPGSAAQPNHVSCTYQNKLDRYKKSQVSYRDHESVSRLGIIDQQRDAMTTSAGQALRAAKMLTITGGEIVTFVGIENTADYKIGERAVLFDPVRMGKQHSGLVSSATTTAITLDRAFEVEAAKTYQIRCVLTDGTTEERTVTNAVGTHTTLSVSSAFTSAPATQSEWGVTASDLSPVSFVVQSVADSGKGEYSISGIRYDANKYAEIDGTNSVDATNYVFVPDPDFVGEPENLNITVDKYADPGGYRQDAIFTWSPPDGRDDILSYDVEFVFDGAPPSRISGVTDLTYRFSDIEEGEYTFYVRANTLDATGAFAPIAYTVEDVAPDELPIVTGLELFNQGNNTEFANRDAKFIWRTQTAYQPFQELGQERYGAGSGYADPQFKDFLIRIYSTDLATIYREEEGVLQPDFTYTYEKNLEDGGPYRSFVIGVTYRDRYGNMSEEAYLLVNNPQIGLPSNVVVTPLIDSYKVSFDAPSGTDFSGVEVHHSDTPGFTPSPVTLVAEDNSTEVIVPLSGGLTRYVRVGMYDTFGKDNLVYSAEQEVTPDAVEDIQITLTSSFTPNSPLEDYLSWTSGDIAAQGSSVSYSNTVAADDAQYVAAPVYVYWTFGEDNLKTTTTFATATATGNALIASYSGGVALELFAGAVNIKPTFSVDGLEFRANNPSSNNLSWTAHSAVVTESDASNTYAVSSGSVAYTSGTLYVYYVKGASTLSTTTDLAVATGIDREIFAFYTGGQQVAANFGTVYDSTDMTLTVKFTPVPDTDTVNWSAGDALYTYNDIATTASLNSGSVVYSGATQYVYYVFGGTSLSTTTILSNTFGTDRRLVATYNGGSLLAVSYGQFSYDGGDILVGTVGTVQIADLAVGTVQIADLAVDVDKIADDAITTAKIADDSIDTDKLADTSVSLAKFANGLTPIEIVSSLPTTGNYEGRTVFLTADGFMYRYSSGAFTKSVAAADLTGQIGTTQIADDAVTVNKIVDDAVSSAKIADNAVTSTKIVDDAVTVNKIIDDAVSSAKIATNAVTAIKINANAVTANKILAGAVETDKLAANAVTAVKINAGAVIAEKIATNAVTAIKINANAVTANKILAGAVETDKLDANAVTAEKINAGAVIAEKIAADAVTTNKILAGAVTAGKINVVSLAAVSTVTGTLTVDSAGFIRGGQTAYNTGSGFFLGYDSTAYKFSIGNPTGNNITWDGSVLNINGVLAADTVTSSAIASNAVIADSIAANAVTAVKIQAGAVEADKIAANAVTAVKINANAVTAVKIAADAVTTDKILAGAVTTDELAADAVTAEKINVINLAAVNTSTGTLVVNSGGYIRSGQTAFDTGTGFYLGNDSGTPKFSIGNASGNKLTWDGSSLDITGNVTLTGNLSDASSTTGTLTINGALTVNTTGHIKGGQTAYDTGNGFFLGYSGGAYKLSIGNNSGNKITWDGSSLNINGVLAADIVTSSSIASNAVIADSIAANAVTTDKINASAVTAGKISVTNLQAVSTSTGSLTVTDSMVVGTTGLIRGGQTAYDTGDGFFLGYSGGDYKLSIGSASGNKITWDGSSLNISGNLAADTVTADSIVSGTIGSYSNILYTAGTTTEVSSHDWYPGAGTPTKAASSYTNFGGESPWLDLTDGARISAAFQYDHVVSYNAYEWFYWRDQLYFEIEYESGPNQFYYPTFYEKDRNEGARSNTGGGDGASGTYNVTRTKQNWKNLVADISGGGFPWSSAGNDAVRIRAVVEVNARGVSSGEAIRGDWSPSLVASSMRLEDLLLELEVKTLGPTS